ncbi:hypothetical protein JG688_00012406 [Phytophthora aleatoria]|uniref:Uncharacterized protein n=1 Tax=Phytophthora aleatoria TaxID=2496075 RepID=A0A8J5J2R5_9STRA|nr:hypothetical protein JG688_00012406 [Phytophthora aleatoria]
MLVNGVDISMLEGWMIKINSNPSFFGKNMNRRWFKVGFVPGPGSEKKLVISYSTSKTAKDPRGWLYVEDVSGIYCRRQQNRGVNALRRFNARRNWLTKKRKIELNVNTDLTESASANVIVTENVNVMMREIAGVVLLDRIDEMTVTAKTETIDATIATQRNAALRHQRSASRDVKSVSLLAVRLTAREKTRVLVAVTLYQPFVQVKMAPVMMTAVKTVTTVLAPRRTAVLAAYSEEEDADDNHYEKKQADPEEESPREQYTSSTTPIDDDISHDELAQMIPEQMAIAQPSKRKNSEYFDSDEEEHEQPPSKINTVHNDRKAPVSSVTSDNNFVHDDWDAEDEPSSSQPTTKTPHSAARSGGVAADANFVHDDWDD